MHAFNILTSDNTALCLVAYGPKDVENMCNHIYKQSYSIVSIIPINHITFDSTRLFYVYYFNAGEPFIDVVDFYDLHTYISNKSFLISRILPYTL